MNLFFKVLGPNVRATLLKNLHNKSVAEAALSHLANVPKSKDALNMVARRKHQITYLASIVSILPFSYCHRGTFCFYPFNWISFSFITINSG